MKKTKTPVKSKSKVKAKVKAKSKPKKVAAKVVKAAKKKVAKKTVKKAVKKTVKKTAKKIVKAAKRIVKKTAPKKAVKKNAKTVAAKAVKKIAAKTPVTARKVAAPRVIATTWPAAVEALLAKLDEAKAEQIIAIDVRGTSTEADTMVVASGRSNRHVNAIADQAVETLGKQGVNRGLKCRCIARRKQKACFTVSNQLAVSTDIGGHKHAALRHCLQGLQRCDQLGQADRQPGVRQHINQLVIALHLSVSNTASEDHPISQSGRSTTVLSRSKAWL